MSSHLNPDGTVNLDEPHDPGALPEHLTRAAIDACELCDDLGYRQLVVCDHVDHTEAARRGHQLATEALEHARKARR